MYYVNKVLLKAENRYLKIEKLDYALIIVARKFLHYFQAHTIIVLTNQPLKQILQQLNTSSRLFKWSIKLGKFHIEYRPRMTIMAQALADFIAEFTYSKEDDSLGPNVKLAKERKASEMSVDTTKWKLFVEGSSNHHGCGAGGI